MWPGSNLVRVFFFSLVLLFCSSCFRPLLSLPVSNCRLPIRWLRESIQNWQLAIGNWKYRELPGPNSVWIEIHLYCFGDWQGRINVAHNTGRAGLSSGVNLLRFRLFNFGRSYWRCYWSLFVLS